MDDSYYKDQSTLAIEKAVERSQGKPLEEIRAAIREAFPFGAQRARQGRPYKIWRKLVLKKEEELGIKPRTYKISSPVPEADDEIKNHKGRKMIIFPENLLEELEQIAKEEGRTFSELIRHCCRQYLIEAHKQAKRKRRASSSAAGLIVLLALTGLPAGAQEVPEVHLRGPILRTFDKDFTPPEEVTAPKIFLGVPRNASRIVDLTGSHDVEAEPETQGRKLPYGVRHPVQRMLATPIRLPWRFCNWTAHKYQTSNFGPWCRFCADVATMSGGLKLSASNFQIGRRTVNIYPGVQP